MKDRAALIRSLLILLLPSGCVTPYYPPEGSGDGGNLVINGFINASKNSVVVNLSRSISLSEYRPAPAEVKASVSITTTSGTTYHLNETKDGIYEATDLSFDLSANYSLHIVTEGGKSYSSDAISLLPPTVIDSVSWQPTSTGVDFFVSGHNTQSRTGYYRWVFEETFEYNVPIVSYFKKVDLLPVFRDPITEQVYTCWASYPSTEVLVASSKAFATDAISMHKIAFLPKGSRKLARRYRLTVQQHAITQQEFEFWQGIKKTTETLGGLFDPIPGAVLGNVHSDDDANEAVLGYFSGAFVSEKEKYVGFLELPGDLRVIDPYNIDCQGRFLFLDQLTEIKTEEVWVNQVGTPLLGYTTAPANCADCRSLYNGTNMMPDNWPTK